MTELQKENRVEVCRELLQQANDDDTFVKRLITGDDIWVYGYDIITVSKGSLYSKKHESLDPMPR